MISTETIYFVKEANRRLVPKSKKELDAELNKLEKKLGSLVSLSAPYTDPTTGGSVVIAVFRSPDQLS